MVKILDCTIRDGGHVTNWEFDNDFVMNLFEAAQNFCVTYLELGYRNHIDNEGKGRFYKCSSEFLEKFYNQKGDLQLGVMTDAKRFSLDDFAGADADFVDFVRVATRPDRIGETLEIAERLKSRGYKVFVQLMDISNVDADGYLKLFAWENKDILESLYFADSYGKLQSNDVEQYYNKLKILGYKKISFHAHNNIGTALSNTLKAINLGAFSVDVSKNGMGRNGGNLDISELKKAL